MNSPQKTNPLPSTWFWLVPSGAIVLVLVALGALLWVLHQHDIEKQRQNIISDILWAEQNFRFHLQSDQSTLNSLGQEIVQRPLSQKEFWLRARALLANSPELVQLIWFDNEGEDIATFPGPVNTSGKLQVGKSEQSREALRVAKFIGLPAYSEVYETENEDQRFEVHVPLYQETKFVGEIVGVYSLPGMMQHLVPWWHAQKYQLSVMDSLGRVISSKSRIAASQDNLSYQVPLDLPGHSLMLRAIAYSTESGLMQNTLVAAIVLLSAAMVWSLTVLRRHIRVRLAAEQNLLAAHAFRQAIENSMTTGMRARDLEGRLTYVNPAFCRMTGFSPQELLGQGPPHPFWAPESLIATQDAWRRVMAGEAPAEGFELRFQRKNGERFDVLIHEAPLIDAGGKHAGWMGSVLDITERKRAEEISRQQQEQLQFTSRLVTMGEMASTLAHELNQPLSAITSYVTGSLNKLQGGNLREGELQQALQTTATQAHRAGKIIRRVHEFVRRREPRRSACDINRVIEEAIAFVESEARKLKVQVVLELANDPPELQADTIMLEQVVLNLAKNGIEAMTETHPKDRLLHVRTSIKDGTIFVSIADHGCGVAPEISEKLFSPFFTTKEHGMGMGLNICRSIIEFHRGKLWFEPNPDGGSTFCFSLPLAA